MRVLISGSASGIGLATRQLLEDSGHAVIGIDLRNAEIVTDLGTREGRTRAIAEAKTLSGGILDGAVFSAGVATPAASAISVNFFGTVTLLLGIEPLLARAKSSSAVVVSSSTLALAATDDQLIAACERLDETMARQIAGNAHGHAAYSTSKLALARWLRILSVKTEWIDQGIRLNAVAPGLIATPLNQAMLDNDQSRAAALAIVPSPMGIGHPAQVASIIEFLLKPDAAFITGQTIFVDGGSDAIKRPRHV